MWDYAVIQQEDVSVCPHPQPDASCLPPATRGCLPASAPCLQVDELYDTATHVHAKAEL
jgi:hypothetical protein